MMMDSLPNRSTKHISHVARYSGLVYLTLIVTGIIGLAYLPSQVFIAGQAEQTFSNIQSQPHILRAALFFQTLCFVSYIFLPLFLHRLLGSVSRHWALLMVLLVQLSIPLTMVSLVCKYSLLSLVSTGITYTNDNTVVATSQQLIQLSEGALLFAQIFWGGWLIPLGMLIYHSDFMPKWLGILLVIGGMSYLGKVTLVLLYPNFHNLAFASKITLPATIAEFTTCLWLLFGVGYPIGKES